MPPSGPTIGFGPGQLAAPPPVIQAIEWGNARLRAGSCPIGREELIRLNYAAAAGSNMAVGKLRSLGPPPPLPQLRQSSDFSYNYERPIEAKRKPTFATSVARPLAASALPTSKQTEAASEPPPDTKLQSSFWQKELAVIREQERKREEQEEITNRKLAMDHLTREELEELSSIVKSIVKKYIAWLGILASSLGLSHRIVWLIFGSAAKKGYRQFDERRA